MNFGYLFCRRDSYITHRAFCDALIQETVRNPTVSFTSMTAASSGAGFRGFHGKLEGGNALSHQHLSDHPNSGFSSFGGYNLNIASSENSREFAPQTSNPNFLIQCSSSQGMLPAPNNNNNDQSFMNQQGLIQFDPVNNINLKSSTTNNSFFNLGFFQENTKNSETAIPSLYSTDSLVHHREESLNAGSNVSATALLQKATQMGSITSNDPSALLRGLASSSSNDFGGGQIMGNDNNGNLQGLMNSLVAVNGGGAGGSGCNIFDVHFGNNGNMSGSDKLTLDFLGVGGMVRNVNRGRGRGGDVGELKFSEQNHPFGRS